MRILLITLITIAANYSVLAQNFKSPLVSVQWLQENLEQDNLFIFHLGEEQKYNEEHIPGAVLIHPNDYVYSNNAEMKAYDLPPVSELETLFKGKGINKDDTIILYYDASRVTTLTRLYFTLTYLGYQEQTFILDGGLNLWKHFEGSLTNESTIKEPGNFEAKPNDELVVDLAFMIENYSSDEIQVVDARASVFYEGIEPTMGREGHIPGSRTIPYVNMMNEAPNGSYVFKTKEQLQELFDEQKIQRDKPIILYCHIGQQATTVFTAATILGYSPILFDGSFHEWGHGTSNPVEID